MKYIKKYANATVEAIRKDGLIRGKEERPCLMYGRPTLFVDICSEARFCGETCCNKFYREQDEALRKETA